MKNPICSAGLFPEMNINGTSVAIRAQRRGPRPIAPVLIVVTLLAVKHRTRMHFCRRRWNLWSDRFKFLLVLLPPHT